MPYPLDIAAIEARAEAATPGPWRMWPSQGRPLVLIRDNDERWLGQSSWHENGTDYPTQKDAFDNFAFIARAREDIPALIAEVRAARDHLSEYAKELIERDKDFLRLRAAIARKDSALREAADLIVALIDVELIPKVRMKDVCAVHDKVTAALADGKEGV